MMNKPLLTVITGPPASGKSTLARLLSKEIKCPLLSRDEMKEGYINTLAAPHKEVSGPADQHIYEAFFQAVDLFISKGISVIIKAAFQHKLWQPRLPGLSDRARLRVIVCNPGIDLAKARFMDRLKQYPEREQYHGDNLENAPETVARLIAAYEVVQTDAPLLVVDTSGNYQPGIAAIVRFIRQGNIC